MALTYTFREGLAGFRRAKFAVVTATSAMAVALILIGLFGVTMYQAEQISSWLKQRVGELEIFLQEVDEPMAQAIYARSQLVPGVAGAEYVSRKEAQEVFLQEFGEGGEIFFDQPFLPASIKIRVDGDYANPDSLARMGARFKKWNHVDEVVFNQELLAKVQQNLRLISVIGLALGTIVVLAALFLVANTIRLTIYARRLLIRTMKLVGATDAFIRQPFIIEGVAQGVLAGVLSSAAVWGTYATAKVFVPQLQPMGAGLAVASVLLLVCLGA
ncbi:MAG TPA: permease-like cell division protein FtsX, partial [Rhodothermales bacterium]|nr:permease-like cell division protein FtsX [Rhodothermales bacterium]